MVSKKTGIADFQKRFRDKNFAFWDSEISNWVKNLLDFFKSRRNTDYFGLFDYLFLLRRLTTVSLYNYRTLLETDGKEFGSAFAKKLYLLSSNNKEKVETAGDLLYERSYNEYISTDLTPKLSKTVDNVLESLRNNIETIITTNYNKNLSEEEFNSNITSFLEEYAGTSNFLSTVVSTLVISSISLGLFKTFSYQYKMWVSMEDERTRASHLAVSGDIKPINDYFEVGSSFMLYPCDINGGLEEIINCRCYLVPVSSIGQPVDTEIDNFYNLFSENE